MRVSAPYKGGALLGMLGKLYLIRGTRWQLVGR